MGRLFYLIGKSVSGKDTLYQKILADKNLDIKQLVIYTTRPIRTGEINGKEYHFVDEDEFQRLKLEGKIIEDRAYQTVYGLWRYFTAATIDLERGNYLGIGTIASYRQLCDYYGTEVMCPIYVEVEDGERLKRAIAREEKQIAPKYEEMCRRFLADSKDFSEENIRDAGIGRRFQNVDLEICLQEIKEYIVSEMRNYNG